MPTFEDVLELVLLQGGPHGLLDGRDVLVQLDHQRVVVHALHVGHDGVVALLGQGDEVMEAMHPGSWMRQSGTGSGTLGRVKMYWAEFKAISLGNRKRGCEFGYSCRDSRCSSPSP